MFTLFIYIHEMLNMTFKLRIWSYGGHNQQILNASNAQEKTYLVLFLNFRTAAMKQVKQELYNSDWHV